MTQKRHISELGLRVATAAVLIPVVIWLTILGGLWYQLLILFLAMLLANELVSNVVVARTTILRLLTVALFLGCGLLSIKGNVWMALGAGLVGAMVHVVISGLKDYRAIIFSAGILIGNSAIVALISLRAGPDYGLSLSWRLSPTRPKKRICAVRRISKKWPMPL